MTEEKKTRKPRKKAAEPVDREQVVQAQRTSVQSRLALKKKVRYFYDIQRLRLQTLGRTTKKASHIDLHEIDLALLEQRVRELEKVEKFALDDVEDHLKTMPFYKNVLTQRPRFKGVGPTMAGVILAEFDITREDTASKMWAFAGLRPMPARRCQKCSAVVTPMDGAEGVFEHPKGERRRTKEGAPETTAIKCPLAGHKALLSETFASGAAQRPARGEKLPYNAFLRTKLVGVLGPVLIKVGSPWRKFYDDYKHRKESAGWGRSDGHRHQAANRYMIKMLLLEIWREWRLAEGLPVRPSYQEEKLGHVHSASHESNGNQSERAGHIQSDTHLERAGQVSGANRENHASQVSDANRCSNASHLQGDSHSLRASHLPGATQQRDATQSEEDLEIQAEVARAASEG